MTRLDINILGISEIWWSGNGDFWPDEYCVIYSVGERNTRKTRSWSWRNVVNK